MEETLTGAVVRGRTHTHLNVETGEEG